MNTKDTPRRRGFEGGVTLTELLSVLAILAVLAAVLFPIFQLHSLPNGEVRDGSGKPLPGAVLRFRDSAGRIVAIVTADGYGNFRQKGLDGLSHDAVDGFGLTHMKRRTGAGTLYIFTPFGTHIATFRDKAGKPVRGLTVSLTPNYYAWHRGYDEPFESVSDKSGIVQAPNIPVGGRFGFLSQDPDYVIERTQAAVNGNTIRYAVTVNAPKPPL